MFRLLIVLIGISNVAFSQCAYTKNEVDDDDFKSLSTFYIEAIRLYGSDAYANFKVTNESFLAQSLQCIK